MKHIEFVNPVGLVGRFVTVRLGDKWLSRLSQGDKVQLTGPSGESCGVAAAADIWNGDLALVPGSLLEMEHDPLCRTYSGLVMGLRCAYRDAVIEPGSNVTVIVLDLVAPSSILRVK